MGVKYFKLEYLLNARIDFHKYTTSNPIWRITFCPYPLNNEFSNPVHNGAIVDTNADVHAG